MSGRLHFRQLVVLLALALVVAWTTAAVSAQPASGRARLSRDLADHVAAGAGAPADVIVEGSRAQIEAAAGRYGVAVVRWMKHGAVLRAAGGQLEALQADGELDHLSGDVSVRGNLAVTDQSIGADQAWAGLKGLVGVTGRGVGVAVIDSGIANVPALEGHVVAEVDFLEGRPVALDEYGHGTHVAGIVAAGQVQPDVIERHSGVSPGAHLIDLKVIGADGSGRTSDVIEAIDWAIENRQRFAIRVINLSLGHPVYESFRDDPLCQAVERAVGAGIVVVAAAGNLGKTADGTPVVGGIESPGNSPYAITVGALNTRGTAARSDDVMATYSSRGPALIDWTLKPDVAAPGNKIVSLMAPGSALARDYPELHVAADAGGDYLQLSGTSMATAVVSGAAALILEANPSLDPLHVKVALQLGGDVPARGRVDWRRCREPERGRLVRRCRRRARRRSDRYDYRRRGRRGQRGGVRRGPTQSCGATRSSGAELQCVATPSFGAIRSFGVTPSSGATRSCGVAPSCGATRSYGAAPLSGATRSCGAALLSGAIRSYGATPSSGETGPLTQTRSSGATRSCGVVRSRPVIRSRTTALDHGTLLEATSTWKTLRSKYEFPNCLGRVDR